MRHLGKSQDGFTLIELLVVLVFTGIAATLVMANINRGKELQALRSAAETFVQDVRTIQNYAIGGRRASICSDVSWKYIPCPAPPGDCTDYGAGSTCGEVPEGGYGIEILNTLGYNMYADTYVVTDADPTDGDQRWFTSSGANHDPATPIRTSTLIPPVRFYAIQYNDDPVCTPGSFGPHKVFGYLTYTPPFAEGHVITRNGADYMQDVTKQRLQVWLSLGDDTSRCQEVTINGITGYVSYDSGSCPPKDQPVDDTYCKGSL